MGNAFRVFARDVKRIIKVPPALMVVIALLVLPSAYAWYNVVGFWNPYDNTGNLRVCVVNEDAGGTSDLTGSLNVGDRIEESLRENNQLDWQFVDEETARKELDSGESYAVFVIPENFTRDVLTLTTGDFIQPQITYYVNEKVGPVAPKITDTGATTLDETINSTFVATVTEVAVNTFEEKRAEVKGDFSAAQSKAVVRLSDAQSSLATTRSALNDVSASADEMKTSVSDTKNALTTAKSTLGLGGQSLSALSTKAADAQAKLGGFSAKALPAINTTLSSISQTSSKANETVAPLLSSASQAQAAVGASLGSAQAILNESEALSQSLRDVANGLDDTLYAPEIAALNAAADKLDASISRARSEVDGLEKVNNDATSLTTSATSVTHDIDTYVQTTVTATSSYSESLFNTALPQVSRGLGAAAGSCSELAAATGRQQALIEQSLLLLDGLNTTLDLTKDALAQTDKVLEVIDADLQETKTDMLALGESGILAKLLTDNQLDVQKISDFMGSPTQLVTEQLYPLNAYGSAMAPLFMNLTFWIGAFMLVVIMKQEVDGLGIKNLTVAQRYLGRFILFAAMASLQAIICCAGLLALGVQAQNIFALFFAAVITSLAYLSIIYFLSVTLQHIGKGICIVLVFAQIPGATGLYPIEMTSGFFQAIYPYFPFTYGISAMREAICGFYGNRYVDALALLALYFFACIVLGLVVRPLMANVNRMVAHHVREGGLFNGEDCEIPARPYRSYQLLRALADKQEYREELKNRYLTFAEWYPRLMRGALGLGVVVPLLLVVVFSLTPTEKVWILTIWLLWFALHLIFVVVLESLRESIQRQMKLDGMAEEDVLAFGSRRNKMEKADAPYASGKGGERRA